MADEMEMIPVTSSQIAAAGYNPESREMRVEFANGSVYAYAGVTQELFDGLIGAASPGQYFHAHVKSAGHVYTRLK